MWSQKTDVIATLIDKSLTWSTETTFPVSLYQNDSGLNTRTCADTDNYVVDPRQANGCYCAQEATAETVQYREHQPQRLQTTLQDAALLAGLLHAT